MMWPPVHWASSHLIAMLFCLTSSADGRLGGGGVPENKKQIYQHQYKNSTGLLEKKITLELQATGSIIKVQPQNM